MVEEIVNRFAEQAPAAVLFRSLFARVFSNERIDQIFRDHKQRQVESDLVFSSLIHLLTPVVSGSKPTVHASFQASEDLIGVSSQAVYDKLRKVEAPVCEALVRIPTTELAQVCQKAKVLKDDLISGYHTFIIDGKRLDGTEHRLLETRRSKSAPLPGTVLALLDTRLEMFVDVACDPDAYACERKVVQSILNRLQKNSLYIADRNFCDGPLISQFVQSQAFFLLRHHGRSPSWRKIEGQRLQKIGKDKHGGTVYEQRIEIRLPDGSWHSIRRITIKLAQPTRDNDTEIHLLTNLPFSISAVIIADAYSGRWTIETCLGYLAQSLNAEINTLAYPGAALLCYCLGLVLFNMMSALKTLLYEFSTTPAKPQLSYYYLALEIAESRLGMQVTIDDDYWEKFASMPLAEFAAHLRSICKHANLMRYRKHPRGPKRPPPKRTTGRRRPHVSTHRLLKSRKSLA